MDKRGFPTSLPEFQQAFPSNEACADYLENLRWVKGFICPNCGKPGEPYRFPSRSSVVLRCRNCNKNTSLTAGTIMEKTHTPLLTWFWAAYLVTTQTQGMSTVQLQRQLGIKRYETAFNLLHKLRAGMVRNNRDSIGGKFPVEVDECLIGGRTKGEGKGTHHMTRVVGAVEVRPYTAERMKNNQRKANQKIYAGRLRLQVAPDKSTEVLTEFVQNNVSENSKILTDGWKGYNKLPELGYEHYPLVLNGNSEKAQAHLPMIHLVFSNLKTWIQGTHHGRVEPQHLQSYLDEFVFRFNRRFYPMTGFHSVLGIATQTTAPTYSELYSKRDSILKG